ncbi:hypothetical protein [Flavobacterium piscisymbiosum]|uniref:Uncharacterized protein n=1 Tax=Flavobacterium piscisymbiosum TaxID=2893753 RepID=A0ABS8MDM1_9FLAO|nr:hypothetical protein [Flavobacterium sp. F-30]MCC9063518.1 hypothetical protein [Flavobacterium sp. F-30]MCC9065649.1 hypothetical protein [Flavobacterium sp. F-30]
MRFFVLQIGSGFGLTARNASFFLDPYKSLSPQSCALICWDLEIEPFVKILINILQIVQGLSLDGTLCPMVETIGYVCKKL